MAGSWRIEGGGLSRRSPLSLVPLVTKTALVKPALLSQGIARSIGPMDETPDFLSTAGRQMAEARALGAIFQEGGSWVMSAGRSPLPSALTDRLRVHRKAISALVAEKGT